MTPAIPCVYCGCVGYHTWSGIGGCPGVVPERERDAAAAWLIRTLVEQNANLQVAIGRHALLCGQAADALEEEFGPGNTDLMVKDPWALIADLRKAAKWNELHEPRI